MVERDSGVGLQNLQPEKAPLLEGATPSFLNNPQPECQPLGLGLQFTGQESLLPGLEFL